MNLGSLLKPEAVKVVSSVTSKKRLLQELSEIAHSCYGVNQEDALDALQDRESIGPTGVGEGVALPHARVDTLDNVVGVFVKIEKPLAFEAVDRQPVDLVFALFAPADTGVGHLRALALVSRVLRNPQIRAKLRANEDSAILYTILTGEEATQAA